MRLTTAPGGEVTVEPRASPTSRAGLCQRGWTAAEVLRAPDRLTTPLVRRHGRLEPTGWDEALDLVATGIRRLHADHGPDSVAVFGGGGLTNEKAYALGKFARVALRTRHLDYNGRFCMAAAAAASNRAFGADRGVPFPIGDLAGAEAGLLLGSKLPGTIPPFVQPLTEVRRRGGLVVVDPRRSATAALTDGEPGRPAGVHLQPLPGT